MYGALPFEGITIVDCTHVLTGLACAYYFGLQSAEVKKIKAPIKGDAKHHRGLTDPVAAQSDMSAPYLTQAAGKKIGVPWFRKTKG